MGIPVNTAAPTIAGTPAVNAPLLCDKGTWTSDAGDIVYSYQWARSEAGGQAWTEINGAANVGYLVTAEDVLHLLRCFVHVVNDDGASGAFTDPTVEVPDFGYFVVEDGTGLINANSFATVAHADAYHALRNRTEWLNADLGRKQAALVEAADYIETRWSQRFQGERQFPEVPQNLSFPRTGIGYDDQVPLDIQRAAAEYALRALSGPLLPDPVVNSLGVLTGTRNKVGPIETEVSYQAGASVPVYRSYPVPDALIRPYIYSGGGRLVRA